MSIVNIVVVGGVAAGASAAARCRRLNEQARITVVERGPDVSFANCGMPYHIGGAIESRSALAVQTPESLRAHINADVRTLTEAVEIDRAEKRVRVRPTDPDFGGEGEWLPYDFLVLAPGALPVRPPLPGIDLPQVHTLRSLQDMDAIKAAAATARRSVLVGAGFIGVEMAEQLAALGGHVSVVEMQTQVLPSHDPEMTRLVASELERNGVELVLGDGIAGFEAADEGVVVRLASGRALPADLVLLAIGVRPDSGLARAAGLELGPRGHILVDGFMRTSDPAVYAAGDAVQMGAENAPVALAGLANRQGRLIADHIFARERARPFKAPLGTAIVRVFDVAAGVVGLTEKRASPQQPVRAVIVHGKDHAGYFPGAQPIAIKLVWCPETLRVLGAQVVGCGGVDKRTDVLATAIAAGMTIYDVAQLELAYAPPFGSARDPVNVAGTAAVDVHEGLVSVAASLEGAAQVVDVRPAALAQSHPVTSSPVPVVNVPVTELRARLGELDREADTVTVCGLGKSAYFAARILRKSGFRSVASLRGGLRSVEDARSPAAHF